MITNVFARVYTHILFIYIYMYTQCTCVRHLQWEDEKRKCTRLRKLYGIASVHWLREQETPGREESERYILTAAAAVRVKMKHNNETIVHRWRVPLDGIFIFKYTRIAQYMIIYYACIMCTRRTSADTHTDTLETI